MGTKRYRLKIATWTVVREAGQPSPRKLDSPEAVVELARDLFRDQDDDREHFWAILLNAQNRSEEHTSELQSRLHLVCRLLLEKKKENVVIQRASAAGDAQSCP